MLNRLRPEENFEEEEFGILTDDELYLDCVLVKPRETADADLRVLRVWVPRYPLNKSSVITCARQEVQSYGPDGKIAHLVFDLRGTGESDGDAEDVSFDIDLLSIKAWADERFGTKINFGFLGAPLLEDGRVNMIPIRPGVIMETYHYGSYDPSLPSIFYLSSYGNFDRLDDARCSALADAGYEVHGLDPLRYLLHASASDLMTPDILKQDLEMVCEILGTKPRIIAQPIAAGLGLMMTALVEQVKGVTAVGVAQPAFRSKHIFDHSRPHNFMLTRYMNRISPRPVALVWQEGHALGGDKQELAALYKSSGEPRRLERTKEISPQFLLKMLRWQENQE